MRSPLFIEFEIWLHAKFPIFTKVNGKTFETKTMKLQILFILKHVRIFLIYAISSRRIVFFLCQN